jgi:hypothetical protein
MTAPQLHVARSPVGPSTTSHREIDDDAIAARAMLGRDEVHDRLPYLFSDQYDVGVEYARLARSWNRVVFGGDPAARDRVAVCDRRLADPDVPLGALSAVEQGSTS